MCVKFCLVSCAALLALAAGCAMCSSCDDYSYAASGGRWERLDPCFGRVGSAFTPEVGTEVDGAPSEPSSESIPPGEPTPANDPAPIPPVQEESAAEEASILHEPGVIAR